MNMNMIIIFYIVILVDLFFIQLLLYLNFRGIGFVKDLILNHLVSKDQEKMPRINQSPSGVIFTCPTCDKHSTNQHPFFEPKINRDK